MKAKLVFSIMSLLYGVWLDLATGTFAGMGEGPIMPWTAAFGSPLSLLRLPGWPLWLLFGYLAGAGRTRAATALLLVHYASAPLSIASYFRNSLAREWQLLSQLLSSDPLWFCITFGSYVAGQTVFWVVLTSKRSPRT